MTIFALEQTPLGYRVDFVLYGAAVALLGLLSAVMTPPGEWKTVGALALTGVAGWSLGEYVLHRFVLHGLQPFRRWHEAHHDRPAALICAPTVLSGSLILALVLAPSWWWCGPWRACSLTLGVVAGYLAYAVTHHATHHWRARSRWLIGRKRWHGLHHGGQDKTRCYGVTSALWDHVFLSARRAVDAPARAS